MKSIKSTALAAVLASVVMLSATACNNDTSSAASSNSSVAETTTSHTEASKPDESETSEASSEATSSEAVYEYVKDGKFMLPNNKLSFTMPETYEFISSTYVYQFTSKSSDNKFNFAVSTAPSDINEVTESEMTASYSTTMQDFKLVDFKHTEVAGKPAIYMQLTGKLYGMENMSTVTQYLIQSGDDAYCFTFTQTDFFNEFPTIIEELIESLQIS